MPTDVKTIAVYADTRGRGTCRGCGAAMTWAEVVASGKRMPFTGDPVPLRTENQCAAEINLLGFTGGRVIDHLAFDDNHWASCQARDQFKKGSR